MQRLAAVLALVLVLTAIPAAAGDDRRELTPFIGYRFGGEFHNVFTGQQYEVNSSEVWGISFDFPVGEVAKIEVLYSRQDTEIKTNGFLGAQQLPIDLEYWHVGGLFQPGDDEDLQPFVVFTIGGTHVAPESTDFSSETRFSFSFGGGGKFFFGEHIGLRLEGRIYGTVVDGGGAAFCGTGGCSFGFSGNVLWQAEASLGVIFAF
jgi:hypothetical protein